MIRGAGLLAALVVPACTFSAAGADAPTSASALAFTSSAFTDGGTLPAAFTCDGAGTSPPLAWSGAPTATTEFALLMTTMAPDALKWNWVLSGIPADTLALAAATTIGTAGLTSDGPLLAYSPPCSQGPGAKSYTFTLFAIAAAPTVTTPATGPTLTAAIADLTLGSSALTVTYTRP